VTEFHQKGVVWTLSHAEYAAREWLRSAHFTSTAHKSLRCFSVTRNRTYRLLSRDRHSHASCQTCPYNNVYASPTTKTFLLSNHNIDITHRTDTHFNTNLVKYVQRQIASTASSQQPQRQIRHLPPCAADNCDPTTRPFAYQTSITTTPLSSYTAVLKHDLHQDGAQSAGSDGKSHGCIRRITCPSHDPTRGFLSKNKYFTSRPQ
jgi:hypothetical protein